MSNPVGLCECGCGGSTPLAPHTDARRGYVKDEPLRFCHGHRTPPTLDNWTEDNNGCWIWRGTITGNGYAQVGRLGRSLRVHRLLWAERNGEIPVNHELHHVCGVKACVNPEHLELVTRREHRRRHAKLTIEQVREIRASSASRGELAVAHGVRTQTVDTILAGGIWADD